MKYLLTLLLCCPPIAVAAEPPAGLSLAQVEALWQNKNRELQLIQDQARASAADKLTAAQRPNPTLSFNTTSIPTGQPEIVKKSDSVVRIDQLFERGDKRGLRIKEAALREDAANADYADAKRQGHIDLYSSYYDLVFAQQQLRITEDNAQLFTKSVNAARLRLQAGDLAAAELARLQVDALHAQNDVDAARNSLQQAQAALAYRIGAERNPETLAASDSWPDLQPLELTDPTDEIIAKRPDVIAADKREQAAEAAFAQAQALRKRDVTIGVQVEHNGQNSPLNTVGVGFSVPLMTGYAYEGEIAHARIDLESAQRNADQTRAQARVQIAAARSDLIAAYKQVERFDRQLLPVAQRALAATEFGYLHGAMPVMDLLDARRTYKSTQIDAANAHANYAKALSAWHFTTDSPTGATYVPVAGVGRSSSEFEEVK